MKKVGFISLGCPKNLVDSEVMMGQLKQNGYQITADAAEADTVVVNTCGFIDSAKKESIETVPVSGPLHQAPAVPRQAGVWPAESGTEQKFRRQLGSKGAT